LPKLDGFPLQLNTDNIVKLLRSEKANKQDKKTPLKLLQDIETLKIEARKLIHPRAIYEVFESSSLAPGFLFKRSEKTILAICTIGIELETRISKLMDEGNLAQGVILDSIASEAAEETASIVDQQIKVKLEKEFKGKDFTYRFSPGYCQWTLAKGQKIIFRLLPAEEIDVKLSSSMMMIPRKSVSFAVNIGDNVDKELGIRECETCNKIDCAYRKN